RPPPPCPPPPRPSLARAGAPPAPPGRHPLLRLPQQARNAAPHVHPRFGGVQQREDRPGDRAMRETPQISHSEIAPPPRKTTTLLLNGTAIVPLVFGYPNVAL